MMTSAVPHTPSLAQTALQGLASVTDAAGGPHLPTNGVTQRISGDPELFSFFGHHPTPRQGQKAVSSGRPWPACSTTPRTRCWFVLSESRKARMPAASELVIPLLAGFHGLFDLLDQTQSFIKQLQQQ